MKRSLLVVAAISLCDVTPGLAQGGPDTLVNVQVLSKDTSRREVMNFMRGVTLGLGVRCEYCHSERSTLFRTKSRPNSKRARCC